LIAGLSAILRHLDCVGPIEDLLLVVANILIRELVQAGLAW